MEALNYVHKTESKKLKKKTLKKSNQIVNILPIKNPPEEGIVKPLKKKRSRLKRQRAVNSNLNSSEIIPNLVARGREESLKFFGVSKVSKLQTKQKPEPQKKIQKGGSTNRAMSKSKMKSVVDSFGDSSSSEDTPAVRTSVVKKKKNRLGKKRALSALVTGTKRN